MAFVVADRVKVISTTTGTGTYTLGAAEDGYQDFAVVGDGNETYYTATNGIDWEVGVGTFTALGTTLSRDEILSSSNSNNAVNWGAGDKEVFVAYPSGRSIFGTGDGTIIINQQFIGSNCTIDSGTNGLTVGPYLTAPGVSVTVTSGQRWQVL
jgi:hypothetical protein